MGAGLFKVEGCGLSLEHPTAREQTISIAAKANRPALLRTVRPQLTDSHDTESQDTDSRDTDWRVTELRTAVLRFAKLMRVMVSPPAAEQR
jgi:hypothetical protein